jgi:hypothetical protein
MDKEKGQQRRVTPLPQVFQELRQCALFVRRWAWDLDITNADVGHRPSSPVLYPLDEKQSGGH